MLTGVNVKHLPISIEAIAGAIGSVLAIVLLIVGLTNGGGGSSRAPTASEPYEREHPTSQGLQGEAIRQFNQWNELRHENDVAEGRWDDRVADAAQRWADKLAEEDRGSGQFYARYPDERSYVVSGVDPHYNQHSDSLDGTEIAWKTDAFNVTYAIQQFSKDSEQRHDLLRNADDGTAIRMGVGIAASPQGKDSNGRTPYYIVFKMR